MDNKLIELMEVAKKASLNAYAPYSNFQVGSALLTKNGEIYTGCNIENSSYSITMCAERTALFKAVSEGKLKFQAIAIYGGEDYCYPCGACRQALSEFCSDDFTIVLENKISGIKTFKLSDFLPFKFNLT